MTDPKKSLFANFKFVVLDNSGKHFQFLKDEEEVKRWLGDGSIQNGDIIIELTEETVRVAVLKKFIELA